MNNSNNNNSNLQCDCPENFRQNVQRRGRRSWQNKLWTFLSVCAVMAWHGARMEMACRTCIWMSDVAACRSIQPACRSIQPTCSRFCGKPEAIVPVVAKHETVSVPEELFAHTAVSEYYQLGLHTTQHCSSPAKTVSGCTPASERARSSVNAGCDGWLGRGITQHVLATAVT